MSFSTLPAEIQFRIFSFLSVKELLQIRAVDHMRESFIKGSPFYEKVNAAIHNKISNLQTTTKIGFTTNHVFSELKEKELKELSSRLTFGESAIILSELQRYSNFLQSPIGKKYTEINADINKLALEMRISLENASANSLGFY